MSKSKNFGVQKDACFFLIFFFGSKLKDWPMGVCCYESFKSSKVGTNTRVALARPGWLYFVLPFVIELFNLCPKKKEKERKWGPTEVLGRNVSYLPLQTLASMT